MGFGHRIYQAEDPRSRHLRKVGKNLCQRIDRMDLYRKCQRIQDVVHKERKIYPNVDFYTGLIYRAMGFPTKMFTVLFAIPRMSGWLAHWQEHLEDAEQKISRPRQWYAGPDERDYVPVNDR